MFIGCMNALHQLTVEGMVNILQIVCRIKITVPDFCKDSGEVFINKFLILKFFHNILAVNLDTHWG